MNMLLKWREKPYKAESASGDTMEKCALAGFTHDDLLFALIEEIGIQENKFFSLTVFEGIRAEPIGYFDDKDAAVKLAERRYVAVKRQPN